MEGCILINRLNHNLVHNINEKELQYLVVESSYRNNALIVFFAFQHDKMMDKQDYARAAVRKIELYQINHIYPGDRLIITFETEQNVLNSKIIENLIEKYLI